MFQGRHDHTIDKKGRVSVPAVFRTEILRRSEQPPMLTNEKTHLVLYPRDRWQEIVTELSKKSEWDEDAQDYIENFVGAAMECPIDSQGRILVPQGLRDHASLESKVSLVGTIDKIRIWDTAALEEKRARTWSDWSGLQRKVRDGSSSTKDEN